MVVQSRDLLHLILRTSLLSRDPNVNSKGRHYEWGRSVFDLIGVFSIEKFIQLWGNSPCGAFAGCHV